MMNEMFKHSGPGQGGVDGLSLVMFPELSASCPFFWTCFRPPLSSLPVEPYSDTILATALRRALALGSHCPTERVLALGGSFISLGLSFLNH